MERKCFIRNLLFSFGALLLPPEKVIEKTIGIDPYTKRGFDKGYSYTIKNRSGGETTMALTEVQKAEIKLQYAISAPPAGKYFDLRKIIQIYYKK